MKGFGNLSSLILSFSNVKYHLEKTNNYVAVAINELGLRGGGKINTLQRVGILPLTKISKLPLKKVQYIIFWLSQAKCWVWRVSGEGGMKTPKSHFEKKKKKKMNK